MYSKKGDNEVAKANSEWVEVVVRAIVAAYQEGKITSLADLLEVARQSQDSFSISTGQLKTAVITRAKASEEVRPIITALRKAEAEKNSPFTEDSPISDLPLSTRLYNLLRRAGIDTLGDLLSRFDEKGEKAFFAVPLLSKTGREEIIDVIEWSRKRLGQPPLPKREGMEREFSLRPGEVLRCDSPAEDLLMTVVVISKEMRTTIEGVRTIHIRAEG